VYLCLTCFCADSHCYSVWYQVISFPSLSTGLWVPNFPSDFPGIEHVVGYESMSIDPDDFEGKLVLIIGRGEQFILSRKSTFMVLNRAKFLFRSYDYL